MNSKRPPDRIPKLAFPQLIVLREDLDAFGQAEALDSHSKLQCQVVDIDSAFAGQRGLVHKHPKMTAPFAHLEGRFHVVLVQGVLQLE